MPALLMATQRVLRTSLHLRPYVQIRGGIARLFAIGSVPNFYYLPYREELARQNYQRLQLECKTDQAQKDLARLAIIRKKREEEAAKNAAAPK